MKRDFLCFDEEDKNETEMLFVQRIEVVIEIQFCSLLQSDIQNKRIRLRERPVFLG